MRRRKGISVIVAVAAAIALVAGGVWAYRHDRAMHAALRELQAQNQADTIFRSDSAAQVLVEYFDRPWHDANDQILAYYLLGRAHADMGEAPQAIEDYQPAVERADTADQDCNYYVLSAVYGQMAEVFHAQNLPESEIEARKKYIHYSWINGDTLWAIDGIRLLERPLYLLGKYDSIVVVDNFVKKQLLNLGDTSRAATALIVPSYIHIINNELDKAQIEIDIVKKQSGIFDDKGNLKPGREMFYYTLGLYHEGIGQLDSAEYYYRQLIPAKEYEAGYKGLLSVYSKRGIADSIAKFAPLYADANDASHDSLRTAEVHKTASLYNYNRHLQQAQQERREKQHLKNILLLVISAFLIIGVIVYQAYRREKEEQKRLAREYHHAKEELEETRKEIEILHEAAGQWAGKEALLGAKELKLRDLQQQLSFLKTKLKAPYDTIHPSQVPMADIMQHFHTIASPHTIETEGQQPKHIQPRAAKANEWKTLIELIGIHYHHFYLFITIDHQLSNQEYRVCILSRLQFETSEIATLLGTSMPAVSNARRSIAAKLFQLESAIGLDAKLMEL